MATRALRITSAGRDVSLGTWAALVNNADVGAAYVDGSSRDRTVQLTGNFAGNTVVLEGSNDGLTYATLHDEEANVLSFTAAASAVVAENSIYIRPRVSAG